MSSFISCFPLTTKQQHHHSWNSNAERVMNEQQQQKNDSELRMQSEFRIQRLSLSLSIFLFFPRVHATRHVDPASIYKTLSKSHYTWYECVYISRHLSHYIFCLIKVCWTLGTNEERHERAIWFARFALHLAKSPYTQHIHTRART